MYDGGGPAGVVDGFELKERLFLAFGVLGEPEPVGRRKDMSASMAAYYELIGATSDIQLLALKQRNKVRYGAHREAGDEAWTRFGRTDRESKCLLLA